MLLNLVVRARHDLTNRDNSHCRLLQPLAASVGDGELILAAPVAGAVGLWAKLGIEEPEALIVAELILDLGDDVRALHRGRDRQRYPDVLKVHYPLNRVRDSVN